MMEMSSIMRESNLYLERVSKMHKVRILFACMLLLLLSMGAIAHAQGEMQVMCGNLSAEDCAVLQTASMNMSTLTSGSMTADLSFAGTMDGTPSEFGFDIAATWTGAGIGLSPEQSLDLASADPTAIINNAVSGIAGFNGSLSFTITPPPGDTTLPAPITLDLRLVDSIGYINFDSLAMFGAMMGPDFPTGWGGTNLVDLFTQLGPMIGSMTGDMSSMMEATPATQPDMAQISTVANQYITITRDGGTFNFAIDLAGLLNDPQIQSMIEEQGGEAMSAQDLADLENASLTASMTLTGDSQFIQDISINLAAESEGEPFTMTGTISFADHNAAPLVTAPEGATIVTTEELMNGVGGAMGAMGGS